MKQIPAGILVFCGGGIGASLRYALTLLMPESTFPHTTLLINLLGAFFLGFLTGMLAGSETARARFLRLSVGTGMMGGFTTYSTFAVQSLQLIEHQQYMLSIAYIIVSLAFGVFFCWLGFLLSEKLRGRREA